jgi:hypothetical protein
MSATIAQPLTLEEFLNLLETKPASEYIPNQRKGNNVSAIALSCVPLGQSHDCGHSVPSLFDWYWKTGAIA